MKKIILGIFIPLLFGLNNYARQLAFSTDTDHDGMPDEWERKHGLNPNNAEDRNIVAEDGYTMLEKYINSIK